MVNIKITLISNNRTTMSVNAYMCKNLIKPPKTSVTNGSIIAKQT